jgi:hypothetical protein
LRRIGVGARRTRFTGFARRARLADFLGFTRLSGLACFLGLARLTRFARLAGLALRVVAFCLRTRSLFAALLALAAFAAVAALAPTVAVASAASAIAVAVTIAFAAPATGASALGLPVRKESSLLKKPPSLAAGAWAAGATGLCSMIGAGESGVMPFTAASILTGLASALAEGG